MKHVRKLERWNTQSWTLSPFLHSLVSVQCFKKTQNGTPSKQKFVLSSIDYIVRLWGFLPNICSYKTGKCANARPHCQRSIQDLILSSRLKYNVASVTFTIAWNFMKRNNFLNAGTHTRCVQNSSAETGLKPSSQDVITYIGMNHNIMNDNIAM